MTKIPIGKMDPTPKYWQNFIVAVHKVYWDQYDGGHYTNKRFEKNTSSARQIAIKMLKEYGGTVCKFGKAEEIRFDNEHDATMFMLKWS